MSGGDDASASAIELSSPKSNDISTASTVAAIELALQHLHTRQATVTTHLDSLLASHASLTRHLTRLDLSRARLGSLAVSARSLSQHTLSSAASTADRISRAVARLDLEQARVNATLAVVEQVAELKACVLGVVGSMGAPQDWEAAAEYLHRAARIAPEVVASGFAEGLVPTEEVPDAPRVTLERAAEGLCGLFLREFERAVEEGDGGKVTRFFKMFPLIGRAREGIDAYGRYVCRGVAMRARSNLQVAAGGAASRDGLFYAGALTKLFEHIAQVIDAHSVLVERHYGAGTMVKVIERLHAEADVQGGIILDTWSDERAIDRKLIDLKSYAHTFLVQSFLGVPKANSTPRAQSPANAGVANRSSHDAEEGIEMKEVDQVLSEIVAMLGRWSLYLRFISYRATVTNNENEESTQNKQLSSPQFLAHSSLITKVSKLLIEPFISFATFFLRRSVERAFELDEAPSGLFLSLSNPIEANPPFITSAVDDVMYVVNQILQRSLATSQATVVAATVSTVGRVLGSDFIGMIQRKMRDESYPKAAVQGSMPPEDKIIAFLVLINNLDVAIDYIQRIVSSHITEGSGQQKSGVRAAPRSLTELFPMNHDAATVRKALVTLERGFSGKAMELINDGLTVTFQQVVKPRMRPILAEAFRDADYSIFEDSSSAKRPLQALEEDGEAAEGGVRSRIQLGWEALVKPLKKILTDRNSERLMVTVTAYFSNLLEKRIWSYHGRVSELGGVRLERDVADVSNLAVRGENFKLRDSFNKCLQIVTIMNMDDEEWVDGGDNGSERLWVLNANERERARTMIRSRD